MAAAVPQYVYDTIYLKRWDAEIPAAKEHPFVYLPLAALCDVIGVDKRKQVAGLKADSRFTADIVLREVPFKLAAGWRMCLSIRSTEAGLWIGGIDPARCKLATRGPLADFQVDLMHAAQRLLFPGSPHAPVERRGVVGYSQRERIRVTCLDCGAPHLVVIEDGRAYVVRDTGEGEP